MVLKFVCVRLPPRSVIGYLAKFSNVPPAPGSRDSPKSETMVPGDDAPEAHSFTAM
jgi:hypothetical protein